MLYWLKFFFFERIRQCCCCRYFLLDPNAPFYQKKAEHIQFDFIYLIKIINRIVIVFFSKKFSQLSIFNVMFVNDLLKFFDVDRHVFFRFEHGVLVTQADTDRRNVVFADNAARQEIKNPRLDRCLRGPCQVIDLMFASRRTKQYWLIRHR